MEKIVVSFHRYGDSCTMSLTALDDGFHVDLDRRLYAAEAEGETVHISNLEPVVFSTKSEAVEYIKSRAQTYLEDAFAA